LNCKVIEIDLEEFRGRPESFLSSSSDTFPLSIDILGTFGDGDPEVETSDYAIPLDYKLGPEEPISALLERLPRMPFTTEEFARIVKLCAGQPDAIATLARMERGTVSELSDELVPVLAEGLLPQGMVVGLVGNGGIGKSTLAHQIALSVAGGAVEVLGHKIQRPPNASGLAVYLTGEDPPSFLAARQRRFMASGVVGHVLPIARNLGGKVLTLAQALAKAEPMRPVILIVDPWSLWMGAGASENATEDSNAAFELVNGFAQWIGACVILVHHTGKSKEQSKQSDARNMKYLVRGSQALSDRLRLLFGLVRLSDGSSVLAVSKNNLRPHIADCEVDLSFDPETDIHHPRDTGLSGRQSGANRKGAGGEQGAADAALVAAVVARLVDAGERVNRTGARSLFERRPSELADWPRRRVEAAIAAAITSQALAEGGVGIVPTAVPVPTA